MQSPAHSRLQAWGLVERGFGQHTAPCKPCKPSTVPCDVCGRRHRPACPAVSCLQLPCVWSLLVATGVIAAAIMPVMQLAGHPVGLWLLMPLMLGLVGVIGGIMTTVGPAIFPSAVRASGYNLGHNLAMSIFGGLSPLIISALAVVIHPASNAAGVVVVMTALLTFGAGVVLVKVVPWTNAPAPAGSEQQHLQEQAAKQQEATAMQQVVVPAA